MKSENKLTLQIYGLLRPLIGPVMAEAAIMIQSRKAGKNHDTIDERDLPALADLITHSLIVFLGTDGAARIAEKIKKLKPMI
jgi:hypothetical protein